MTENYPTEKLLQDLNGIGFCLDQWQRCNKIAGWAILKENTEKDQILNHTGTKALVSTQLF